VNPVLRKIRWFRLVTVIVPLLLMTPFLSAKEILVCMRCPGKHVTTLAEAIRQAEPGDTVVVKWEPDFPIFVDHLVIDKPITLISRSDKTGSEDFDSHPILTVPFDKFREVIDVTVPGVVIKGFTITNLGSLPDDPDDDTRFDSEIGIRLRAPASISHCQIIKCRTAILIQYPHPASGGLIDHCRLGHPTFASWSTEIEDHPGNFFGVVVLPPQASDSKTVKSFHLPEIRNNTIVSNRYYGIVFPVDHTLQLSENIIELNGRRPFRRCNTSLSEEGRFIWVSP
jgi:hypothetical protein